MAFPGKKKMVVLCSTHVVSTVVNAQRTCMKNVFCDNEQEMPAIIIRKLCTQGSNSKYINYHRIACFCIIILSRELAAAREEGVLTLLPTALVELT